MPRFMVTLTEEQRDLIQIAASAAHRSMSNWIKLALIEATQKNGGILQIDTQIIPRTAVKNATSVHSAAIPPQNNTKPLPNDVDDSEIPEFIRNRR
jgi:hypothetical protein